MNAQVETLVECCPKFDPIQWDDKIIEWKHKKFIKDKVFTFFYMPINFGKIMVRLNKIVTDAGAIFLDGLCLSRHTSKWNMDVYLAVDKEINGAENAFLSGKFYNRVYEGSFNNTGKWKKDFEAKVKAKGLIIKNQFTWYTTCPKCAKKYGKNYVVLVAEIE